MHNKNILKLKFVNYPYEHHNIFISRQLFPSSYFAGSYSRHDQKWQFKTQRKKDKNRYKKNKRANFRLVCF